ncbi:MAG TPA: hypothetical protein VGQ83_29625, partial [Polyangia bacterium]
TRSRRGWSYSYTVTTFAACIRRVAISRMLLTWPTARVSRSAKNSRQVMQASRRPDRQAQRLRFDA